MGEILSLSQRNGGNTVLKINIENLFIVSAFGKPKGSPGGE
jgi:hypothetical protein